MFVGYSLFPGLTHAAIPAEERQALIALYNSTNGDHWTQNSGWKEGELDADGFAMPGTEGSWYGITLNAGATSVYRINLDSNSLSGSIPSELGNLTNLQYLLLGSNQLIGSIPLELGKLKDLQWLDLAFNQLTGSIPPELGNLTNLQRVYLLVNQLTGSIPPELGSLTNLLNLLLGSNQLIGSIPPELGNLASLQWLDLGYNQLAGSIPPELGNLTNLQRLGLPYNQLIGSIPLQLMYLTNLLDNNSTICGNHLFTNNEALRDFLNSKQIGGDWESCQYPPFTRAMPWIPSLLLDTEVLSLRSRSFSNGAPIPVQHSLQGGNLSPPLSWSNAPANTKSFVLIMDDPDAPGGTWDHWIVYNIPAGTTSLAENAGTSGNGGLPSGAAHGTNSWGNNYYQGPSPPSGTHRYYFKLYALSVSQLNPSGTNKAAIEAAMVGKIVGQAELMGTYTYSP